MAEFVSAALLAATTEGMKNRAVDDDDACEVTKLWPVELLLLLRAVEDSTADELNELDGEELGAPEELLQVESRTKVFEIHQTCQCRAHTLQKELEQIGCELRRYIAKSVSVTALELKGAWPQRGVRSTPLTRRQTQN